MPPKRHLDISKELQQFVSKLPPPIKKKIRGGLETLLEDPAEGKPLAEELEGFWSLSLGRVRIVYKLAGLVIEIVAIGPRATIYQEVLERLRRKERGSHSARQLPDRQGVAGNPFPSHTRRK